MHPDYITLTVVLLGFIVTIGSNKLDAHQLRGELSSLRHDLQNQIATLRQELQSQISTLRHDLQDFYRILGSHDKAIEIIEKKLER